MATSPLPTRRRLLTSLIGAIGTIPIASSDAVPRPAPASPEGAAGEEKRDGDRDFLRAGGGSAPGPGPNLNPLALVADPADRALVMTLHVLFPSLLLAALDLLERGLVTRLRMRLLDRDEQRHPVTVAAGDEDEDEDNDDTVGRGQPPPFYLVRSAQAGSGVRHGYAPGAGSGTGGGGGLPRSPPSYVVRPAPWNCTCAAFAFSAFPAQARHHRPATATTSSPSSPSAAVTASRYGDPSERDMMTEGDDDSYDDEHLHDDDDNEGRHTPSSWRFGGLSRDGLDRDDHDAGSAGGIPCCKHLLACVLAERWPVALGRYVAERADLGRAELAGIIADV